MHQSVMTKIKNYFSEDRIFKTMWNMVLTFLRISIDGNNSIEKLR